MSRSSDSPAVWVAGLQKSFGDWPVLWDLDLEVGWGEFLVLFGANGSGKTTLLRILSTQARPEAGTVRIAGYDQRRQPTAVRRQVGVVAHSSFLYDDLTCRENLIFYGRLYRVIDLPRRVDEVLERVNLTSRAHQRARTLSHGSRAHSTTDINIKLTATLPRKTASRLTGVSNKPSSPPCSFSRTKARFIASTPAKAKATQRMPAGIAWPTEPPRWGWSLSPWR